MPRHLPLASLLLAGSVLVPLVASAQTPPPVEPTLKDRVDQTVSAVIGSPMTGLDLDMKRVMDEFAALEPKPIAGDMTPEEARKQPTLADAARSLLRKNGQSDAPEPGVTTKDVMYEGAAGQVEARVYTPENASGPLPVVLFFHGGGWVIANIDTYDASARAMAKQANAIIISAHYRQAPENRFPAAHEDAVAAYKWVLATAQDWGGDPKRVAVMGESAGANMAINVSIAARDQNLQAPLHQALVYPVAGADMETQSYGTTESAVPLNKAAMEWFVKQTFTDPAGAQDPRIDLVGKADVKGLPSTTLITAEIDPLRSEGQALAGKLKDAGVTVNARDYEGVVHEFFGLGSLVADAKDAQTVVAADLKAAFEKAGK